MGKAPVAFSGRQENAITGGLFRMADKIKRMHQEAFTIDELMELFIPEIYRSILQDAFKLTSGGGFSGSKSYQALFAHVDDKNLVPAQMYWINPAIEFQFSIATQGGFLVPTDYGYLPYKPTSVLNTAPEPLRQRFNALAEHLIRVSYELGLVRAVFLRLNQSDSCTTPAQMRFIWPSIHPLLVMAGGMDEIAQQVSEPSSRAGDRAVIPREIRDYLKPTYDIVAKLTFLRELPLPNIVNSTVTYRLHDPVWTDPSAFRVIGY